VPKAPNVPTPPVGYTVRGVGPYQPPQGAADPSARHPAASPGASSPPNGGAAMARNAVEAVRAAVFAATTEHARISHSTVDEMSPAPNAMRNPPATEAPRAPEIVGPGGRLINEDALLAEADRLAIEAVRRAEEAKTAAQRAERKAAQAKLASDAALIAAEAVRLAQTSGLKAAAHRLEEAHQLEQRMISGAEGTNVSSPTSVLPPQPKPLAPSVPPSVPGASAQPSYLAPQSHRPSVPPPMSVPPMSGPMSTTAPRYAMDPSYATSDGRPSLDPYAFQSRLKPSLFRLNAYTLVALAVAAFMLAFVVLWAFFG
jgi:hypothetical protein